MGGGRIGEMIFDDPPGSFGAMSQWDKMIFERGLNQTRDRMRRKGKLQEIATLLAVHLENQSTENTSTGFPLTTEQLVEGMKRHAQKHAALYDRLKQDEISLLGDALDEFGLTINDISNEQLQELVDYEDELFREYLMDDEE